MKTKTVERIWQKNQGGLTLILYMLEVSKSQLLLLLCLTNCNSLSKTVCFSQTVRDPLTAVSLAGILHECVATKTGEFAIIKLNLN